MKKINLFLFLFFIAIVAKTQTTETTGPVVDYVVLEKKLEKSNEAIQNPKKNIKPSTWIDRAELFLEINDVILQYLRMGMTPKEAEIFFRNPKEIKKKQENNKIFEEYIYDRFTLVFDNGALVDWEETDNGMVIDAC